MQISAGLIGDTVVKDLCTEVAHTNQYESYKEIT